ncbi:NUMOD3 domain-containing DNA-binding protein [Clostridium felsineum]|uniref:NUMOD3 domain-containing DNA-binding protein n=1 Tax=Clostridium felsineum TaxID=36839 RepID=UPI00098C4E39|nr:NUMOD3 domain-containing DNA-binding protein [Clostridium felsineum]URZ16921.1 hypothetical protein CLFE_029680 [Clostridium felsineum DSM 794]
MGKGTDVHSANLASGDIQGVQEAEEQSKREELELETGLIYMAVNKVNGKCYVGQTRKGFHERQKKHRYDATVQKLDYKFYRAIRKYGWEGFTWQILEDQIPLLLLNYKECFYIYRYGSFTNGYNSTSGGDTGMEVCEATKQKISEAQKGEKNPMYGRTGDKCPSYGRTGEKHPFYGKSHSEATKQKLCKPVLQLDKKTGAVIAEFPSMMDAERQTGIYNGNIVKVCRGKQKSAGGYCWQYKEAEGQEE